MGAREVHRPSIVGHHNFNKARRIEYLPAGQRSRRAQRERPGSDQVRGSAHRSGTNDRLVTLHVHDRGVPLESRQGRHFRDPLGS